MLHRLRISEVHPAPEPPDEALDGHHVGEAVSAVTGSIDSFNTYFRLSVQTGLPPYSNTGV